MNKLLLPILMLLLSCAGPLAAQSAFSSLEEQMTGQEFDAAGLAKLSPAELEALNEWIRRRSVATLDAAKPGALPADARGFETQAIEEMDRTTITSRLVGTFSGWDGKAVFQLENGMIWEQADKDKFYVKPIENPTVTIEPGSFRTWRLSVEGYDSNCRVERIQ